MLQDGMRQAAESGKVETTADFRRTAIRIYFSAVFQHKQNGHSHAYITVLCGPQGKHVLATIKSALWKTKWTLVFPRPARIQYSQQ